MSPSKERVTVRLSPLRDVEDMGNVLGVSGCSFAIHGSIARVTDLQVAIERLMQRIQRYGDVTREGTTAARRSAVVDALIDIERFKHRGIEVRFSMYKPIIEGEETTGAFLLFATTEEMPLSVRIPRRLGVVHRKEPEGPGDKPN